MKVVILCGGRGSRLNEVTEKVPKPMALISGKPILWHIMKIYMHFGFYDFILLLGYKGDKIKEYFMDYHWRNHNFTLNGEKKEIQLLEESEKWRITFIDTGLNTMTGSRVKQAEKYIHDEIFMLTYGDGLANINVYDLVNFHKRNQKIGTVTGVTMPIQYGKLLVEQNIAKSFQEKPHTNDIINGGFFVFNRKIFSYIKDDCNCILEKEPLIKLAEDGELTVYQHKGFWLAIDTYKDLLTANEMWKNNNAYWKVWQ